MTADSTHPPANWYPDVTRRHELRYWNGADWTEHVFTGGVQAVDPLPAPSIPAAEAGRGEALGSDTGRKLDSPTIGRGWQDMEVAGESYRRAEIARVFLGLARPEGGVTMQEATLVPEPKNPHDRNAVKVIVRGEHVGYVPGEASAQVAAACKRLGRSRAAKVPARIWARVDDGVWRARVTLAFSGEVEDEKDYAAERRESVAREAERAAALSQKAAERAQRDREKQDRRAAGTVRHEYWTTWKPAVAELKRQQRLTEARDLLAECRDAALRESLISGSAPAPWPSEQLSAVLRRMGDRAGELSTLEEYVVACRDQQVPSTVTAKLAKARIANGASTTSARNDESTGDLMSRES